MEEKPPEQTLVVNGRDFGRFVQRELVVFYGRISQFGAVFAEYPVLLFSGKITFQNGKAFGIFPE